MFENTDAEYCRRKAAEERQKARETMNMDIATTHHSRAEKYLARADELAAQVFPGQ